MLVDGLRIPFYMLHWRTVFLIYVSRSIDPTLWLVSCTLAAFIVAARIRNRRIWFWSSVLALLCGIALGAVFVADGAGPEIAIAGTCATLAGCALTGVGTATATHVPERLRFGLVFLLTLSLLILPAEIGSLLYYTLSGFWPSIGLGMRWELLEMQLWYTAFLLVPFLYAAFLFSWIWAPMLVGIARRWLPIAGARLADKTTGLAESKTWFVFIVCFALLAAFLGYYPYFHDPAYSLVGTDIYWRNALPAQRVLSSGNWLQAAARERHPVVVLGIALLSGLLGLGVESILRFAYIGLNLVFGLTIFVLVFAASRSKVLASLSALMSVVGAPATVGMYTGTIAEWIALIVWVMSLVFLAIAGRSFRRQLVSTCGLTIGSLAVLFIHPWTWAAMMVGLVAYLVIVLLVRRKSCLHEIGPVLAAIFFNATGVALSLLILMKTQGWRLADALSLVQGSLRSNYFGLGSWEILVFFSQIWSQFLNPVLLGLAALGAISLVRRHDRLSWIVLAWIIAGCATNVFAAPMGYNPLDVNRGETQIFRAMFLTPFQIPAALGLLQLKSTLSDRIGRSDHAAVVVWLFVGVLFLILVNGAFRALFPLLTDPHNYSNPFAP